MASLPSDLVNVILKMHQEAYDTEVRDGVYRKLLPLSPTFDYWDCLRSDIENWVRTLASWGVISYVSRTKTQVVVDEVWYTKDVVQFPAAFVCDWNPSHLLKILQVVRATIVEFDKYNEPFPIDAVFKVWLSYNDSKWHYHTTRF